MLPVLNVAIRADARAAEQLHAGAENRVGAHGDVGIDQDRFGHLDGDAGIHQCGALAPAKDQVDGGKIGARVAAEHLVGIGGKLRDDQFALLAQQGDGIGEVKLAMVVRGPQPREAGPKLGERECVDAGIDFGDGALLVGERWSPRRWRRPSRLRARRMRP